ncbi:MAG: ABC transporter permease [Clostridia bacterium]|nr:ABC transporter permease [Clostridia bacterium]
MEKIKKYIKSERNLTILFGVLLLVMVVFAFAFGKSMYSARNLRSMSYQIPEFGFLAMGMMLSFMIGGIDLSIVSIANTSGIFAAMILTGRWLPGLSENAAIALAIIVAMGSATLFGLFNGFMVAKLSATPLIATLGTMTLYTGIGMALTGGKGITGLPEKFTKFGTAELGGIPVIFIMFVVAALVLALVLGRTGFGRKVYLYGGNPIASRFSAINNERMCMGIFVLIGVLSGIAGLIIISRVNSAKVGYGDTYQLQAMLVCVIGGIHPDGGRGKVAGVVCAILLMQLLSSAFTILRFSPYAKKLIWGSILIIVMGLNYISDKQAKKVRFKSAQKE